MKKTREYIARAVQLERKKMPPKFIPLVIHHQQKLKPHHIPPTPWVVSPTPLASFFIGYSVRTIVLKHPSANPLLIINSVPGSQTRLPLLFRELARGLPHCPSVCEKFRLLLQQWIWFSPGLLFSKIRLLETLRYSKGGSWLKHLHESRKTQAKYTKEQI